MNRQQVIITNLNQNKMNFSKKNHEHRNNNKNVVSKKVKLTTTIMVMAFVSLTVMSCKDSKKGRINGYDAL